MTRHPTLDVETAITGRRSIRRFLPEPVPREVIEGILAVAARAPSGANMQQIGRASCRERVYTKV